MHDNQSQAHWSFVAGIMDSDGCFMISRHKRKTKNGNTERSLKFPKKKASWSHTYAPAIKISMIEDEAILFIMNELGFGQMGIDGARKSRPNSKPIFNWRIRNWRQAIPFLEKVIPFLRVKKFRALHLLEFCNHLRDFYSPGYAGLSDCELDYREDMYVRMREFNGNKAGATTEPFKHESASDSLILLGNHKKENRSVFLASEVLL